MLSRQNSEYRIQNMDGISGKNSQGLNNLFNRLWRRVSGM